MPTTRRPNVSTLFAEISPDLHARLRERAKATCRPVTTEVVIALERHLSLPPEAVPVVEPPAPAPPPPPKKRGRPRKNGSVQTL
jgi:hypothetical protein